MPEDQDLKQMFDTLRREQEAKTPDFTGLLSRERRPTRTRYTWRLATVLAGIAMVSSLLVLRNSQPGPEHTLPNPAPSITQWKAPTDFLLETPGRDLMRTVPKIGEMPAGANPAQKREKPVSHRKTSSPEENS